MTLTEGKNNPQGLTDATLGAAGRGLWTKWTLWTTWTARAQRALECGSLPPPFLARACPCGRCPAYFTGVSPQAHAVPRRKSSPTSGGA